MPISRRLPQPGSRRTPERRRGRRRHPHHLRRWELALGGAVGIGAVALGAALLAGQLVVPSGSQKLAAYISTHAQKLEIGANTVPAPVAAGSAVTASAAASASGPVAITTVPDPAVNEQSLTRDSYGATAGLQTLAAAGTNYDWARIVLLSGGWPQTDANVTVMTRWMRQENGVNDWWNRNNPLNMGDGGFASYPSLLASAQGVAKLIHSNPGMSAIDAGLAAGDDAARTESAIWNSNWAGSHYAYGANWHYNPVDQIKAPASAW